MDIKINSNTVSVNNIIYVSPIGDDANDGLTKSTPVKSWTGLLNVANSGDAIFFMEGEHEFVDDFVDTANMAMFRDNSKKLFFYSDPNKTKLNFTVTKGTNSYGRVQFFSLENEDTILCNLNINIKSTVGGGTYDALNFSSNYQYCYNCFITISTNWTSIGGCHGGGNTLNFVNCILRTKPTTFKSIPNNDEKFCFINSLVTGVPLESIDNQNTIIDTSLNDLSEDQVLKIASDNKIGVVDGSWSLWTVDHFLIKQNSKYFTYDEYGNKLHISPLVPDKISNLSIGLSQINKYHNLIDDYTVTKITSKDKEPI